VSLPLTNPLLIQITFNLPLSDGVTMIDFDVALDKSKKKSEKGLYKIRFSIGEENKDKLTINDVEFLCTGFI
jgi:hypothetical protein